MFNNKTVKFIIIINLIGAFVVWLKTLVYKAIIANNINPFNLLGVTLNLGKNSQNWLFF